MSASRGFLVGFLLCLPAGCTYGPEEERTVVVQIVQFEDSYDALLLLQHDTYRRPTGLSAFPDGGKWRFVEREAIQYVLDASRRTARVLTRHLAPDSLWESFGLGIRGLEGDSVAYVVMTGCPRGGECYPALLKASRFRVSLDGEIQVIDTIPPGARLPGNMLARREGEERYVRLTSGSEGISGLFEEGGAFEPLFTVEIDGTVVATGG